MDLVDLVHILVSQTSTLLILILGQLGYLVYLSIMENSKYISKEEHTGFCIIKISLIKLMLGSQVWIVEKPTACTFFFYEPLKTHTY